jgi:flagellar biogenesis protein FliO
VESIQQIAAVCLVLALAVIATRWLAKVRSSGTLGFRLGTAATRRSRLIERLPLTPQHSICLVRVDEKELFVGLHPGGMAILGECPSAAAQSERVMSDGLEG